MSISCQNSSASNPTSPRKLSTPGSLRCPERVASRHRRSFTLMGDSMFRWSMSSSRRRRSSLSIRRMCRCCWGLVLFLGGTISAISRRLSMPGARRIRSIRMGRCWRGRWRCRGMVIMLRRWSMIWGSILILIVRLLRLGMCFFLFSWILDGLMSSFSFFSLY